MLAKGLQVLLKQGVDAADLLVAKVQLLTHQLLKPHDPLELGPLRPAFGIHLILLIATGRLLLLLADQCFIIRGILLKGVGLAILYPQVIAMTVFALGTMLLAASRFRKKMA